MKSFALLVPLGLLVLGAAAAPAFAQSTAPVYAPAPPPPGMNDPGVKPVAAPASKLSSNLPAMHDARQPRDAKGEPPPEVRVRKQGDETVQEYARNGQVYMVVVTPKIGPPQTYMVDANGKYHNQGSQEPVKPVMYKVVEWGKARPPEETEATPSNDSH
ncbi:DUF2782 domain-containing protein [Dyella silvatica]|uniref:DUF2782 domain-containing protein n=1 Tax=Dyella silvatica TaxID=2992128 RepID=UPI00224E346E|nr:DUF2782 domain-containing protein [Dyella silvatica]